MWTGAYWIGLNDAAAANDWVYNNGDDNSYSNWADANPLDFEPYNCGRIGADGKWQSGRCDLTTEFFCMIKRNFRKKKKIFFVKFNFRIHGGVYFGYFM